MSIRPVRHESTAVPHLEGAGVHLKRAFGFDDPSLTDPFLLFDDFRNSSPEKYLKGFPWASAHPGNRDHHLCAGRHRRAMAGGNSLGNTGTLGAGDVQWMTARPRHQCTRKCPRAISPARCTLPALGQFAVLDEDDRAALSGRHRPPDIPVEIDDDGTAARYHLRRVLGQARPGRRASPPSRPMSTSLCRRARRRHFKVDAYRSAFGLYLCRLRHLPRCLQALRRAGRKGRSRARRSRSATCRATARLWSSTPATRSPCRLATKASASCWSPASRSKEPVAWHGRDRHETLRAELNPGRDRAAERHLHQAGSLVVALGVDTIERQHAMQWMTQALSRCDTRAGFKCRDRPGFPCLLSGLIGLILQPGQAYERSRRHGHFGWLDRRLLLQARGAPAADPAPDAGVNWFSRGARTCPFAGP